MCEYFISFVIIEFFCVDEIRTGIDNIRVACNGIRHEIIISSNSNYPSDTQLLLRKEFPDIKWVFNDRNGGFAYGMNSGISGAEGEILAILNPDVRINKGDLLQAIEYLSSHPEVGVLGPKIIDQKGNIQDSCRSFLTPGNLCKRFIKRIISRQDVVLNHDIDYNRIQLVDWVIGAFMMIRRDALKKVGQLDEGYFLYIEDMDWCKRFWDNGYKIVYYPKLVIEYKGDRKSTSALLSKNFRNIFLLHHVKSYLRFIWKHKYIFKRRDPVRGKGVKSAMKAKDLRKKEVLKILIVASAGGHLTEAMSAIEGIEAEFSVGTFKLPHSGKTLKHINHYYILDPHTSKLKYLINGLQSLWMLLRERPDVILTTGAGIAIPSALIGKKIFRAKLIFVENGSRVEEPSKTGRFLYPLSDLFIVQWPSLLKHYPDAKYGGCLI